MEELNNENLMKMFKKQLKSQLIINLSNTGIILLFILIFRKSLRVVIFFSILIGALWLYSGIKMIYLWRGIKRLRKEADLTTLSKSEKASSIEAVVDEKDENNEELQ